jgi:uncharacterized protein YrrD
VLRRPDGRRTGHRLALPPVRPYEPSDTRRIAPLPPESQASSSDPSICVGELTKAELVLLSIKQLYEQKLRASDGDIGHVKDFYFDDQKWVVRYVVVDTGSWQLDRLVLISPHAFGSLDQNGDFARVNLTRQQIENCPPIESHKPVSRQYEEEYYRYYGWPSYWIGGGLWGLNAFPLAAPPPPPLPSEMGGESDRVRQSEDPHLRSTRVVTGYQLRTSEETIGHVTDFLMDAKSWVICHLVVETGNWFFGKEMVISPSHIERISYEDSLVFVSLTKEAILQAPEFRSNVA